MVAGYLPGIRRNVVPGRPLPRVGPAASRLQKVRESAGLSQAQFARLLGVSVKTLQYWEQTRRAPTGPAKALLRIVEREPEAALRALDEKSG
jgi:putative transcriptional regulator